jgi:hypothetical protein
MLLPILCLGKKIVLQDKKKEMLNLRDYQVLSSRIKKLNKIFP